MLRIAVPNKGTLADPAATIMRDAGYRQRSDLRDLSMLDEENDIEFFYLRPKDIATYVGSGDLQLGVTGADLMDESGSQVQTRLSSQAGIKGNGHLLPPPPPAWPLRLCRPSPTQPTHGRGTGRQACGRARGQEHGRNPLCRVRGATEKKFCHPFKTEQRCYIKSGSYCFYAALNARIKRCVHIAMCKVELRFRDKFVC